ncbi:unnamed protein product [Paramecium pentaurelia]|uniref:Uncharacterized protein n=1 Tax=Paramecium pentaurelia TaxID=43138 RepID=A0A8S1W7J8_9CILI|nr:unnamed protein product [Paramecium pentaurelia]
MFSQQTDQKEVITNFPENTDKILESQNELFDNKMRIILMAIEIERLHKILNSKIDYYTQKMQDYIKRELFYKGQIVEYLQRNTELNQQILEKNALISHNIKENSQQEMNMLITQQCLQFEQELKSFQLKNLQLQKENQELRSQFEDAPQLRKKLYDLEQLYSQLLIEKNEEIKQLSQNNQECTLKNSQLDTLNQLLQYKELELLEWQYSSQQTNLIHENQRLKKELKFLNDKLNVLLINNDHLKVKQDDIQNQNYCQTTIPNKIFTQANDIRNQTPRRQQINPTQDQLFNRQNTPSNQLQSSQIPINLQSLSQPQRDNINIQNDNNNNYLFKELIEQILFIQNQKTQSKQSIQNQISLLIKVLNLKQQEISQFIYQKNNYVINQKLSASPQFITNPQTKKMQKYYSLSPNNCYSQPYVILQPRSRSPINQYHKGIKTETTFHSYSNMLRQQITPIVIKPQNIVTYNYSKPQTQIHYHFSPIQKTVVKQSFQNPPYIVRNTQPNVAVQFYQPIKINVNQPNLRSFDKQEQNLNENMNQPEFNVYTTEFQVNSQENINKGESPQKNQINFPKQDIINDKSQQQKSHLDGRLPQNVFISNEGQSLSQKSFEIYQEEQIFNKITLQDPVSIIKQKLNGQVQSQENTKDNFNIIYQQFQDFRSIFKQKLYNKEQEFQKTYSNALEQLQKLENLILVLVNEKTQQISNSRDNKFNRISYEKIGTDQQREYQSYKIEQPNSDYFLIKKQTQINEANDFLQQITKQKKLLDEQRNHFIQLISLQDEIQNKYEPLVSILFQKESELNKELIEIKQDKEMQKLNLTLRLQVQSEEITKFKQQNSYLQQKLNDYKNELKDVQLKLKFEHDQHQITKQIVQSLQQETDKYQDSTSEIQKRNSYLEQQIKQTEQLLFEAQTNSKKQKLSYAKETQTISFENQQTIQQQIQNDQIEIENLKQKLCFEQEFTNQLNDSISTLQQQIQTQEQLLQIQKLNNSNQFDEIQNLTKEKIEISQQLKMFQVKYLSLYEQLDQIQKQKDIDQNNEQIQNIDIIKNLNFQIEDMKQINQFLSNQISQIQSNSEIQISAQNTVLSSKIALLKKQLASEKQLKEQANIRIMELLKQFQGLQNHIQQDETSDLKEQIIKLSNQQQLQQQQKQNLIESFEQNLNQLKQQINELTHQNSNFQEQIKDFETKQLLHLQLQKQFANQTNLINQQQQQIVILQQENNQNQNDLQKLRQNQKLDIQDFEDHQNDQINYLKQQIDELNLYIQNQQRDINYLESQIQFEQREKNIITQNKTNLDRLIKQMQEENIQLQNQIQIQQNNIESLSKNIRQSNTIHNQLSQTDEYYQNQNEIPKLDNQLKQDYQILIQEYQKLKDALYQITEEKNKLEMILNYQNQVQESKFQEIKQSQTIIKIDKNEEKNQLNQNEFKNKQHQIKDLDIQISAALVKLDEFDDLNIRNEQIKYDLQIQIQRLKQQTLYIQQLRTEQIEQDKNKDNIQQKYPSNNFNQKIDELIQIIQILIISIGDHIQLNSKIVMNTQMLYQLLVEINKIIESFQYQNQTLKREGNLTEQQNYSTTQKDYQKQSIELIIENDQLKLKLNQYQRLLIQLQDEYYKQGSALDNITKEYQQIIDQNEYKVIKLIDFEQLNNTINKQEKQIEEYLDQIQYLQNHFDQEQKKQLEEGNARLNNKRQENQKQMDNQIQIIQENIKLKQEISNLQSELQKQNYQEDLREEQKLIQKQSQEEYTQLKQEAQRLYQRLLQMSNSNNILKEEKEQEQQRYQRECKQIQENLEKHKNENIQYKLQIDRLSKQLQEQKSKSESNLQQEFNKLQYTLDASLKQQKQINDEKRVIQAQVQQQQEQLANQLNIINQLKKEISKQEQIISQLSQQNNIQSSFVQEVTFFEDLKNSSPFEFKIKQLQNENSHLHQLLIDTENDYSHKIKLQQLQIQGLNDKLREMVYEQNKKNPKVDEFVKINNQNH